MSYLPIVLGLVLALPIRRNKRFPVWGSQATITGYLIVFIVFLSALVAPDWVAALPASELVIGISGGFAFGLIFIPQKKRILPAPRIIDSPESLAAALAEDAEEIREEFYESVIEILLTRNGEGYVVGRPLLGGEAERDLKGYQNALISTYAHESSYVPPHELKRFVHALLVEFFQGDTEAEIRSAEIFGARKTRPAVLAAELLDSVMGWATHGDVPIAVKQAVAQALPYLASETRGAVARRCGDLGTALELVEREGSRA